MRRRRARVAAFQVLYQDDFGAPGDPAYDDACIVRRLRAPDLIQFARSLVDGVRRHRPELDHRIASAARNWSLDRMAATDRNLLRLGAYEILYGGTPPHVAIDEAVELAKRFGTAQSAAFVNGILDRLMREQQTPSRE